MVNMSAWLFLLRRVWVWAKKRIEPHTANREGGGEGKDVRVYDKRLLLARKIVIILLHPAKHLDASFSILLLTDILCQSFSQNRKFNIWGWLRPWENLFAVNPLFFFCSITLNPFDLHMGSDCSVLAVLLLQCCSLNTVPSGLCACVFSFSFLFISCLQIKWL